LVLGGGANVAVCGEAGKESGNVRLCHFGRVAFPMEEDEPFDPTDIGFLRLVAVLACTDVLAHPGASTKRGIKISQSRMVNSLP
jgi:hypothetical protein